MDKLERKIERAGFFKTAQALRLAEHYLQLGNCNSKFWTHQAIRLDYKIRECVQWEIRIQEQYACLEHQAKHHPLSDEELQTFRILANEIDELERVYWRLTSELQRVTSTKFRGPLQRAYAALHEHPGWFMSKHDRKKCAERGGCCARDCGCCSRPRATRRVRNLGHCTDQCPCCWRVYGGKRHWPAKTVNVDSERIGFREVMAHVWGI
ncbi:uncharacterized protein ACLA_059490 [Aspergillus clavatus NRRL 1]|uniref:Uncharacterized protein n=1 Tax=Aspergillus clavatus (strain ATCC 1007 / CBS 513.65 / DSM 816 / NCTC 3887 / NRRL 1 / QM 1276 / 107) TaxID=344612 RepID=A1C4E2_ASPCL|nr:uncharacterized protein ACLA_059490 [Aspergillus clavatus NRRL 1]EAW15282.1 hypothetical protein ACLA_059490 [Aspergillus clavatus NRRL 1]